MKETEYEKAVRELADAAQSLRAYLDAALGGPQVVEANARLRRAVAHYNAATRRTENNVTVVDLAALERVRSVA